MPYNPSAGLLACAGGTLGGVSWVPYSPSAGLLACAGGTLGGVSWVPYSGLSLLFYPAISIGEMTDTYHIDQRGGLQFTVGAQYIF